MDLIIDGGLSPKGSVKLSGAKNAATKQLSGALLTEEEVVLRNFPTEIVDAQSKANFIKNFGADVKLDSLKDEATICAKNYIKNEVVLEDVSFRTTYLLVASQLMRSTSAVIPYPGGCKIGERKHDLHIMVWKKFGANVKEKEDGIYISCKRLKGALISFPFPTVGGTENAVLCGAVAHGTSEIENAYISPEVYDLISLLRSMGSYIDIVGKSKIIIEGNPSGLKGTTYDVMPDRIEALTWIIYAILANAEIEIQNVPFYSMEIPLIHLMDAGVDVYKNSYNVLINNSCVKNGIQPFELACGTHPGIISDMQPFFVLLALAANGNSRVIDYRYPERTTYLEELKKFIVKDSITWNRSGNISIKGPNVFKNAVASATDLRGGMAIIIAALIAKRESKIIRADIALRGYNKLIEKLLKIGVKCKMSESNNSSK